MVPTACIYCSHFEFWPSQLHQHLRPHSACHLGSKALSTNSSFSLAPVSTPVCLCCASLVFLCISLEQSLFHEDPLPRFVQLLTFLSHVHQYVLQHYFLKDDDRHCLTLTSDLLLMLSLCVMSFHTQGFVVWSKLVA